MNNIIRPKLVLAMGAFGLSVLLGCGDDSDGGTGGDGVDATVASEAVATYARIVSASYADSVTAATDMDSALQTFVATPSAANLTAAKNAWLAAREPYLQTEVYRFYDGPIDNPEDGPEGLLNAWPMDESHIDYVLNPATEEREQTGIVNDASGYPTIDATTLEGANEDGGEENVATGFHPIEFLLWGQDQSVTGPGDRPHTDYVEDGTAENPARRGEYLLTASALLIDHLSQVDQAWAADGDNYRAAFETDDAMASIEKVLTGMIILSGFETGGERLQTALDSGEQEDEHSCFSDNTHRDMVGDVIGVRNVYEGSYTALDGSTVSGTGIRDVVASVDPALASRLGDEIEASVTAAEALMPPFDQEIAPTNEEGNARVETLITALRTQESTLSEVFSLLGLSVEIPE